MQQCTFPERRRRKYNPVASFMPAHSPFGAALGSNMSVLTGQAQHRTSETSICCGVFWNASCDFVLLCDPAA